MTPHCYETLYKDDVGHHFGTVTSLLFDHEINNC